MIIEKLDEEVTVIDDIVPVEFQNEIEKFLTEQVPWRYSKSSNYTTDRLSKIKETNPAIYSLSQIENSVETPQFVHEIFEKSPTYIYVKKILDCVPYKIGKILRIKANFNYAMPSLSKNNFGVPHVDFSNNDFKFITAVYYVNDTDGDTIIFDDKVCKEKIFNSLKIRYRIKPKKGRMVLFNGNLIHAGSNPTTDTPRILINFNFTVQ